MIVRRSSLLLVSLVGSSLCGMGCGDGSQPSISTTEADLADTSYASDTCDDCDSGLPSQDSLAPDDGIPLDASTPIPSLDLHPWKLTLPLADSKTGWAKEVKVPELLMFSSPPWFEPIVDAGESAWRFRVPVDGVKTSSKTKFARSELREMATSPSYTEASWSMSDGHIHRMKVVEKITALTLLHPRQAVGQIHDPNNDTFMLLAIGNNEGKGIASTAFTLTAQFDDSSVKVPFADLIVPLNDYFTLEVLVDGAGKVTVTVTHDGKTHSASNGSWKNIDPTKNYFKAGNYIQSNVVDYREAPGAYSEVVIRSLEVHHD